MVDQVQTNCFAVDSAEGEDKATRTSECDDDEHEAGEQAGRVRKLKEERRGFKEALWHLKIRTNKQICKRLMFPFERMQSDS